MIKITDQVLNMVKRVEAFDGRVYRSYPQQVQVTTPFCVISEIGHNTELTNGEGEELIAGITFSIDIYSRVSSANEDLHEQISNTLLAYNILPSSYYPDFQPLNGLYRVNATYRARIDVRGQTYT